MLVTPSNAAERESLRRASSNVVDAGFPCGIAPVNTFSATNFVTRAVIAISLAGVVDTAPDLAFAPLEFKKVSTLGLATVGDGHHADYYLASYDPNAPIADIVRSSVDLNKMWRKLIAVP